jgi:hypothetical protein
MAAPMVWNVFLPCNLLKSSTGFLTGCVNERDSTFYVTGTSSDYVHRDTEVVVGELTSNTNSQKCKHEQKVEEPSTSSATFKFQKQTIAWLNVLLLENGSVDCKVYLTDKAEPCECVCILFETDDILSSYYLAQSQSCFLPSGDSPTSSPLRVSNSMRLVSSIFSLYHKRQRGLDNETDKVLSAQQKTVTERLFSFYVLISTFIFAVMEKILNILTFKLCWSHIVAQCPATISQISYKLTRFQRLRKANHFQGSQMMM